MVWPREGRIRYAAAARVPGPAAPPRRPKEPPREVRYAAERVTAEREVEAPTCSRDAAPSGWEPGAAS
jgi:hypothetical protein